MMPPVTTTLPAESTSTSSEPMRRETVVIRGLGDRVFGVLTLSSGYTVLAVMAGFGLFLAIRSTEAFRVARWSFFTTSVWEPSTGEFGVAAIVPFTIAVAAVAVTVAVPISVLAALFITEVAPRWLRSWLVSAIDLMAAVPSVIYGLWGAYVFQSHAIGLSRWLSTWGGWIPILRVDGYDRNDPLTPMADFTASTFVAGIVVSMMVIPIQCSVMREVFSQVPPGEREGAFALGSTRWGMIRVVAFPFGRGGMIGGTMLGLGRALGETIAVVLIISPRFDFTPHILESGSNSVSALIALQFKEASDFGVSALFAAGLTLFAMTLAVNFVASWFVSRSRSGSSSDA